VPITSLKFRPGINKETTSYSNKGGFRFGYPEKLGGWEKYSLSTFLGTSRSLHAWANLEGNKYLGVGTEKKFYIEESQGYNDITPLRRKVVSGVTVFDLGGLTVTSIVSGNAGTSAVGSVTINAQANDTFAPAFPTGVDATGQVGTLIIAITDPTSPSTGQIGDVTVETTVVPTNITVTDFTDES
jgi:hypothetical protein